VIKQQIGREKERRWMEKYRQKRVRRREWLKRSRLRGKKCLFTWTVAFLDIKLQITGLWSHIQANYVNANNLRVHASSYNNNYNNKGRDNDKAETTSRAVLMETTNDMIWNRIHAIGMWESNNQTGLSASRRTW
jgi:hypothetical protein